MILSTLGLPDLTARSRTTQILRRALMRPSTVPGQRAVTTHPRVAMGGTPVPTTASA